MAIYSTKVDALRLVGTWEGIPLASWDIDYMKTKCKDKEMQISSLQLGEMTCQDFTWDRKTKF